MSEPDISELKERAICADCIGESYLSKIIGNEGEEHECGYCGETSIAFRMEDFAEIIGQAFGSHYTRTASGPNSWQYAMMKDREIDYDWEQDGQQTVYAIMDAADISEEIAQDVQLILEEEHFDFEAATMGEDCEFSSDMQYEEILPGDHEWQEEWRSFERTIKSEARFFSRTAAAQLGELFDSIDKMRTAKDKPLIIDAGPETEVTHFYRARVFQSDKQLVKALMRPDQELSAPPSELAGAGRMNAKGISAFYGATTIEIALAEVRPPVGSQVAVARFELTRPVRLLDLAALSDVRELGSIFDPTYAHRLGRMTFLRSLSARIARPVMPDDQETEYLPTQAIADFLATEGKVPIDGILFPSVQVGGEGLNAVLFHKAARCAEIEIPEGTELSAQTYTTYEDGPEPDYTVIEEVPVPDEDQAEEKPFSPFEAVGGAWEDLSGTDGRDETLRIDLESVRVHQVNAVKIDTTDFQVDRHRWEKKEPPF